MALYIVYSTESPGQAQCLSGEEPTPLLNEVAKLAAEIAQTVESLRQAEVPHSEENPQVIRLSLAIGTCPKTNRATEIDAEVVTLQDSEKQILLRVSPSGEEKKFFEATLHNFGLLEVQRSLLHMLAQPLQAIFSLVGVVAHSVSSGALRVTVKQERWIEALSEQVERLSELIGSTRQGLINPMPECSTLNLSKTLESFFLRLHDLELSGSDQLQISFPSIRMPNIMAPQRHLPLILELWIRHLLSSSQDQSDPSASEFLKGKIGVRIEEVNDRLLLQLPIAPTRSIDMKTNRFEGTYTEQKADYGLSLAIMKRLSSECHANIGIMNIGQESFIQIGFRLATENNQAEDETSAIPLRAAK